MATRFKKCEVTLTHKVPNWHFCNEYVDTIFELKAAATRCRFCVEQVIDEVIDVPTSKANKGRMGASSVRQKTLKRVVHVCLLYNWPLDLQEGILVRKCERCRNASQTEVIDCDVDESDTLYRSKFVEKLGAQPVKSMEEIQASTNISTIQLIRYYSSILQYHMKETYGRSLITNNMEYEAEVDTLQWLHEKGCR